MTKDMAITRIVRALSMGGLSAEHKPLHTIIVQISDTETVSVTVGKVERK